MSEKPVRKSGGKPDQQLPRGGGKRIYRRRPQTALDCNYGQVLDLSAGGMRIVSSKAVAGIIEVRLDSPGADHPMKARVVWCKKLGFRLYEVGLEFTDRKAVAHVVEWISVWTGKKGAA